jgi:hypothetical protein
VSDDPSERRDDGSLQPAPPPYAVFVRRRSRSPGLISPRPKIQGAAASGTRSISPTRSGSLRDHTTSAAHSLAPPGTWSTVSAAGGERGVLGHFGVGGTTILPVTSPPAPCARKTRLVEATRASVGEQDQRAAAACRTFDVIADRVEGSTQPPHCRPSVRRATCVSELEATPARTALVPVGVLHRTVRPPAMSRGYSGFWPHRRGSRWSMRCRGRGRAASTRLGRSCPSRTVIADNPQE